MVRPAGFEPATFGSGAQPNIRSSLLLKGLRPSCYLVLPLVRAVLPTLLPTLI